MYISPNLDAKTSIWRAILRIPRQIWTLLRYSRRNWACRTHRIIEQHRSFAEDRLKNWGHARASGDFESDIAKRFEISSIPRTILVGPDGVIVAVDEEARGQRLGDLLEKLLPGGQ